MGKERTITVRVEEDTKRELEYEARVLGRKKSEYIREIIKFALGEGREEIRRKLNPPEKVIEDTLQAMREGKQMEPTTTLDELREMCSRGKPYFPTLEDAMTLSRGRE